jgi:ribosome recycling factor
MDKTIEVLGHEFATLRAGRANAAVLDRVSVEYYGAQTPVAQIASISTPEPRVLVIQPWDGGALKAIEKAIQVSDLGINPQNDGKVIRLAFPQLTEERRHELIRQVRKYAEESKVALRNIRRDAIEAYKALKKKSEITEDDLKDIEKDFHELIDKYCKDIDALVGKKEKELMEV